MAQSVQVKAVSWQHEALADLMITEPQLSLGECAKRLGFTLAWLSIVKNSDSFKDYFTLRRKVHSDALTIGIKEKAAALAEMSLDVLIEDTQVKLDNNAMSASEARENLDLVAKRFGFDGTVGPQRAAAQVTLNVGMVTAEALEQAREKLRAIDVPAATPTVLEDKS